MVNIAKEASAGNCYLRNVSFHVILKLQIKFENFELNMVVQLPYFSIIFTI
jgi:hypothetical protein